MVSDERDDGVDKKAPAFVCWPLLMADFEGDRESVRRAPAFMIRSSRTGSSGFVNEVSRAVWSVNPDLPLANVRTQQEIYDRSLARTSFMLVMLSIAGVMALLLGVAGIYGVISYAVSQRIREIGIRMALGAQRQEVTRLFVGQALRLAIVGIALGLGTAFALTRSDQVAALRCERRRSDDLRGRVGGICWQPRCWRATCRRCEQRRSIRSRRYGPSRVRLQPAADLSRVGALNTRQGVQENVPLNS